MSYSVFTNQSVNPYGNLTLGINQPGHHTYTGTSYTIDTSWSNTTNPVTITQKAIIDLKGNDADIVINGESLRDSIREIKEALRIPRKLDRDPKMEKAWEDLQAAAQHYETLLKEYKEKQKVWETLKNNDL